MTAITEKLSAVMRRLKRCCARRAMERHPKASFLLSITTILLSACAAVDTTETASCRSNAMPGVKLMIETMKEVTVRPTTVSPDGCEPSILIQGETKEPQKILPGVHGFADRAWLFNRLAKALLNNHNPNPLIVAYDQRSFGWAALTGEAWPGADELVKGFIDVYNSIVRHYGKDKIFVLGHSMGAAVVVRAFTAEGQERLVFGWPEDDPRGLILAAPAICSAANQGYLDAAVFSIIGSALSETKVPTVGGLGGLQSQTTDDALITETLAKGSGFHSCTPLGKILESTRLYADE